jgi:uncharacterized membrane protein
MRIKLKLILVLVPVFLYSLLIPQTVLAYVYPDPHERYILEDVHWIFYAITFVTITLGLASFLFRGRTAKGLSKWGAVLSLVSGIFLIVTGLVKIPWETTYNLSPYVSGSAVTKHYLYEPALLPLGIVLLIIGIMLVALYTHRARKET